jgi:hypothetical protein
MARPLTRATAIAVLGASAPRPPWRAASPSADKRLREAILNQDLADVPPTDFQVGAGAAEVARARAFGTRLTGAGRLLERRPPVRNEAAPTGYGPLRQFPFFVAQGAVAALRRVEAHQTIVTPPERTVSPSTTVMSLGGVVLAVMEPTGEEAAKNFGAN